MKKKLRKTELGEIPVEWQIQKIGELFDIKVGGDVSKLNFSKHKDDKFKYPIYSNSVKNGGLYGYADTYQYPRNCITITARGTLGYAIPRFENFNAIVRLLVLIPKKKIDVFFVSQYINFRIKFQNEKTSVSQLTAPKVSIYKLLVPPLEEQKAIATVLFTVDKAIEKSEQAIERIERLKKGLMQRLLTKGIGHKKFRKTELGEIPSDWKVVKLGDVVNVYDFKRIPLNENERRKMKGKFPYYGANGVIDYVNKYLFEGEYILLAEDGGKYSAYSNTAFLVKGKFWVNNHAHVIKAKEKIANNAFLVNVLNYLDLTQYIVGSTRKKLNQRLMLAIKLPLPSLEEQKKIAKILSAVDKRLELEKKRKEKLERIKKGLMSVLLTGKKRLDIENVKKIAGDDFGRY